MSSGAEEVFDTGSEEETARVGERLAQGLKRGDVVLLYGDLGAGKTAFVRGLAQGLGAPPADVTSPTFTLLQEYHGRIPLYHADLYRLEARDVPDLGLEEVASGGVLAVEWAERWQDRPAAAYEVRITDQGGDVRRVRVVSP